MMAARSGTSKRTIQRNVSRQVQAHLADLQQSSVPANSISCLNVNNSKKRCYSSSSSNSSDFMTQDVSNVDYPVQDIVLNDSTSSDSTSCKDPSTFDLQDDLKNWAIKHNITRGACTDLLKMLRQFENFKLLPSDSRTLFRIDKTVILRDIGEGKMCYFGLKNCLIKRFGSFSEEKLSQLLKVELELSFDGLPISKSTNCQLWPIQCSVVNLNKFAKPFVVGIYFGSTKPTDINLYLLDFIEEYKQIKQDSFEYKNFRFKVDLVRIIADAPARSFVKQCKIFNSYYGCEKCVIKGTWMGRVVFNKSDCEKRTNEGFLSQRDANHHMGTSPFVEIGFGLVTGVPLDYMHLICLGVTRKFLRCWVKGGLPHKLPASKILQINTRLINISSTCPNEFSRRPRSLREIDMWKATEFRSFLLYTGPVVLKNILPKNIYKHFMLLSIATTILISPLAQNTEWNRYANSLLIEFVRQVPILYSIEFLVYNVHCLIHISDDAMLHGALDTFSAFKYENNMQVIKRTLRAKYKPFEQVVNRITELDSIVIPDVVKKKIIKPNHGNNCFLLNDGSVILIVKANSNRFICKVFSRKINFYKKPCNSSCFNIYIVSDLREEKCISLSDINLKCWLLPYKNNDFVCFPLINWNYI